MGRLDGKVALISGGARGQGACETRMFCREGAHVIFGDILDEAGKHVEAEIRAAGGEAASPPSSAVCACAGVKVFSLSRPTQSQPA